MTHVRYPDIKNETAFNILICLFPRVKVRMKLLLNYSKIGLLPFG